MGSRTCPIENAIMLSAGVTCTGQVAATSKGGLTPVKQKVPGGVLGLTGLTWLLEFFGSEALTLYATPNWRACRVIHSVIRSRISPTASVECSAKRRNFAKSPDRPDHAEATSAARWVCFVYVIAMFSLTKRRSSLSTLIVLAIALAISSCSGGNDSSGSSTAASSSPSVLFLEADPTGKLAYTRTQATIPAGPIEIRFKNLQGLPHNVAINDKNHTLVAETPLVTQGSSSARATLRPGRYIYYSSVISDRHAGMKGHLIVE